MQKDSNGYIGFVFNSGKIKSIVKESSAARNGVLTDHQLIEVNGQNVVGVKVRTDCVRVGSQTHVDKWLIILKFPKLCRIFKCQLYSCNLNYLPYKIYRYYY